MSVRNLSKPGEIQNKCEEKREKKPSRPPRGEVNGTADGYGKHNLLIVNRLQNAVQNAAFHLAKCGILHGKTRPFALRKAAN